MKAILQLSKDIKFKYKKSAQILSHLEKVVVHSGLHIKFSVNLRKMRKSTNQSFLVLRIASHHTFLD